MATTREVVEYGYRAALRGKRVAIHGFAFKVMVFLERLLPRAVVARGVGLLQSRRRGARPTGE